MKFHNSPFSLFRRPWVAAGLCSLLSASKVNAQIPDPGAASGISIQRTSDGTQWRLQWKTLPGERYRLQKSRSIKNWIDVTELTAAGASVQFDDPGIPDARRTFWRVEQLGEALSVSPVVASYQLGDTASRAMLQVGVGGAESPASVVFFDNGVALGNAVPGQGDTWTFDLLWDGESPQPGSVSASVTGIDGTVRTTPVKRFLLADPAKFVPIKADGKPAYGEFVTIDSGGALSAFLFYPEGFADLLKSTGAHFSFTAGSTMEFPGGAPQVRFQSASFHRGHSDPAPLTSAPGLHTLPLNSIEPQTVAGALGLPAASVIPLLWGPVPLPWRSGPLSETGWAALKVDLPIGDFQFPGTQSNASVAINPATDTASLVVCFSGAWDPFAGGVHFRVPASDPLKIYLDTRGRFTASGTAEAQFPNGASVRGSLSWRDPYIEFRFQGRGITIPALSSLRQVLPQNPEQCLPAGAAEAELDEAARCLAAFRDTCRQLATGGAGQGDPAAAPALAAPLPSAEDPAGAALAGWAARLESWNADRAGQILDTASLVALKKAVEDGTKLTVASHDAPTAFKLTRDILSIARTSPDISGATPEAAELAATLDASRPHLFAASKRVASAFSVEHPIFSVEEANALLNEWSASSRSGRTPRGGDPAADEAALMAEELVRSNYGTFFDEFDIADEDFDGSDNAAFPGVPTADGMLDFLQSTKTLLDLLKTARQATSLDDAPANFPLREALDQAAPWVAERHNAVCSNAAAKGELGPLVAAVRQRLRIFELYDSMGYPIPEEGTGFLPPLRELALAMEEPFSKQMGTVSRELRLNLVKSQADVLRKAASFLTDPDLNEYLNNTWIRLTDTNSEMAHLLFGMPDCDELERVLTNSFGFTLFRLDVDNEGTRNLPVNGKYESVSGTRTLQLNQAGRYVLGHLQTHSGSTHQSILEGVLLTDTAAKVEFAYVLYPANRPSSIEAGVLSAELDAGTQRLKLKLRETFPNSNRGPGEFRQTSNVPFFAASVVGSFQRFSGEAHRIVKAFTEAPLHTGQLTRVLQEVPDLLTKLDEFAALSANSPAAGVVASRFDGIIENIRTNIVTPQQFPLVRVMLQQVLSKARPANSTRTYWEQLYLMLANHRNLLGDTAAMLGATPATVFGSNNFTYRCTISAEGIGGDFRALKLGGLLLKIHVEKSGPTGNDTFDLIGLVAQGGAGFEKKKSFGGAERAVRDDGLPELPVEKLELEGKTIIVTSPYDYQPADLKGPVFGFSGEAAIGAELKIPDVAGVSTDLVKLDGSGLALFGNGSLPPLILTKDPDFSGPEAPEVEANFEGGEVEFEGGFEASIDATVGYVTNEGDPLEFLTAPLPFRFEASTGSMAEGAVFFDTDSAVIRPCGRQFLRRLVAEYAGVFAGTNPKIRILGMTDTAGDPEDNDLLSIARANSVREALIEIAGPLGFAAEDILAIGLGEEAALGTPPTDMEVLGTAPSSQSPPLVQPNTGTASLEVSEPWVLQFVARRQTELVTIPDNTGGDDGARWRSVVILINNVAALELADPADVAAP